MKISFDLDEVLFVSPEKYKTEEALKFPFNHIFKERLRLGTIDLIHRLQDEGFEVWVYTSSFRSIKYIRNLFRLYNIRFDDIINGDRHINEVQKDKRDTVPQKLPSKYRISLHIDDENNIVACGKMYGYNVLKIYEPDDAWTDKVLEAAYNIRKREHPELVNKE